MKFLNLQETADYLETATINETTDRGFSIVHAGTNASGVAFVLMNNAMGESVLVESAS